MNAPDPRSVIISPVPSGSGAERVHLALAERLPDYRLLRYSPQREYFPALLLPLRRPARALTHAPPDHALFAAPSTRPLFVTFHNYVLDAAMRPFSSPGQRIHYATDLRYYIRRALLRATAVSAVSAATADLVREELGYTGNIEVIPNGVDTRRFRPGGEGDRTSGPLRVLFCGNPTRRKGAEWLPQIAERMGRDAEVVVTGGLRDVTTKGVHSIGSVSPAAMPELYRKFDVLLAPGVREGMSLAVLEAMATGLPVVASDIPSMREIIKDGYGGVLCPLGDVTAFAGALRRLAAAPELRARMGAYNRARVEREHTVEQMADRYRSAFERVLEKYDG